jgi:hypothetical protein
VIGWSIIGLGLVPELTKSVVMAEFFLGSAVLGALGCLLLFGVLLRVMVRSAPTEDVGTALKR